MFLAFRISYFSQKIAETQIKRFVQGFQNEPVAMRSPANATSFTARVLCLLHEIPIFALIPPP